VSKLYSQTKAVISELIEKAKLIKGNVIVVGCSTSEVAGAKIGSSSSPEIAAEIFNALKEVALENGIFIAVQCCEHLNRAIVIERSALPFAEPVNVVPQPKAGGSLATKAYESFIDPIVVESIKADAGIDIGDTLIGMHLKRVAVPVRLDARVIGEANVVAARTRPKFVGGIRAVYDEKML